MSLELCVLASGSSGNCTVVRTPAGVVLIDIGIGPRTAARRMEGSGVGLEDVRAICLTHLDRDHVSPTWARTLRKLGIRIWCHHRRAGALRSMIDLPDRIERFDGVPFEPVDGLTMEAVELAHDEHGSHGFAAEGFGMRLGYATDLGRVPARLIERFAGVDVLGLESNYDPDMQLASDRPRFLKDRIMGGHGHLSNQQAYDGVRAILRQSERSGRPLPSHIVLLHRSRQCNCPKLVRRLFEQDPRIAARLTLAEQDERSEWLRPRPVRPQLGEQLCLAW